MFKTFDQSELEGVLTKVIEQMPENMELILDKLYDKTNHKYDFTLIDQPITDTIENHPLFQIAESGDERLLTHHTTQKLIELKFRHLPKIAFLLDLVLYILYAVSVSFYHLVNQIELNGDENLSNQTGTIYFVFDYELRINIVIYNAIFVILIFLIAVHLGKEIFQMVNYKPVNYFSSVDNWFQLSTLFLAILSITPIMSSSYKIAFASFSILFAW